MEEAKKITERNQSLTNQKTYSGSIRIKSIGHPVKIYCDAISAPSVAEKIIEAQFDAKS